MNHSEVTVTLTARQIDAMLDTLVRGLDEMETELDDHTSLDPEKARVTVAEAAEGYYVLLRAHKSAGGKK